MSQLAYETDNDRKVADILGAWGFAKRGLVFNAPEAQFRFRTVCAVIAGGRGATIVAFAGTDPLKLNDWITDLDTFPASDGVHEGFNAAIGMIWREQICPVIINRPETERALVLAGHSLGGALAVVAASRMIADLNLFPLGIYTYGCPRVGTASFADGYNQVIGNVTYRLVNGLDIVPTLPPSDVGFRHVGRCIQCRSGARFDLETPILSADGDTPEFSAGIIDGVKAELQRLLAGKLLAPLGQGVLGQLFGTLPPPVQDHIPLSYFNALTGQAGFDC
jgi:triacylglycerol lipase